MAALGGCAAPAAPPDVAPDVACPAAAGAGAYAACRDAADCPPGVGCVLLVDDDGGTRGRCLPRCCAGSCPAAPPARCVPLAGAALCRATCGAPADCPAGQDCRAGVCE